MKQNKFLDFCEKNQSFLIGLIIGNSLAGLFNIVSVQIISSENLVFAVLLLIIRSYTLSKGEKK